MSNGPAIEQRWRDEVRAIHPDWDVEWDRVHERFRIVKVGWWKNQQQRSVIHIVQADDGGFMPLDQRTIDFLRRKEYEKRNEWGTGAQDAKDNYPAEFAHADAMRRQSSSELAGCLDDAIPTFRAAFRTGRKK
jgi:hypothetical protein